MFEVLHRRSLGCSVNPGQCRIYFIVKGLCAKNKTILGSKVLKRARVDVIYK
jgi:hypothetical protein